MDKTIVKKLRLPDDKCLIISCPATHEELFRRSGTEFTDRLPQEGEWEYIQIFVKSIDELKKQLHALLRLYRPGKLLWIAYPKKSSGIKSDLSRDNIWTLLKELKHQPVSLISLDKDWSVMRVKRNEEVTEKPRREYSEIDYKNRRVRIPDDLAEALRAAGLIEVFEKLSFTHKKEYVEAVLEARKQETRQRRILKTVEMLKQKSIKK
ncbi:MAG: YdeI/OmpD-associated family protein [Bacteroidales bacterium]